MRGWIKTRCLKCIRHLAINSGRRMSGYLGHGEVSKSGKGQLIPFHCDALLPQAERYASLKFRRCARVFEGDASDAVELAAFLAVVPFHWARWIFHWPRWYRLPNEIWAPPEFVQANL